MSIRDRTARMGGLGAVCIFLLAAALFGCAPAHRVVPRTRAVAVDNRGGPATEPGRVSESPGLEEQSPQNDADATEGIFHRVEPGQTLWRIARAYGVSLDELEKVNGISDPTRVEVGQAVFIPRAGAPLDVPLFPAPLHAGRKPEPPLPSIDAADEDFSWPVAGGRVLSHFGARRRTHRHSGIDIGAPRGQEILAAQAGVVVFSGRTRTGYGTLVILDHGNGLESLYAHNQDVLVRVGDAVEKGTPIARVGRSGNATAPHCHFEIRKDKTPIDPLSCLAKLAEVRP